MSEEHTDVRQRLKGLAARAVTAAKTAANAASMSVAKAAATENTAALEGEVAAESVSPEAPADAADGDARDERDETIERLEQEIEAERAKTVQLEGAVKELEFKLDVLDRSYGKQLADARADGDAAKHDLTATRKQLSETLQELKQVSATRDRLRDMFAFDGRRVPPELREQRAGDDDTIGRLMSIDAAPGAPPNGPAHEHEPVEPEAGELLSADLVFNPDEDADDEHAPHEACGRGPSRIGT